VLTLDIFSSHYYCLCKNEYLTHIESRKPILTGIIVFAIIALLTQLLAYQRYLIFKETQNQKIVQEATFVKEQLVNSLSYSLSATQTLAFIVDQYGIPERFDSVAAHILESNKYIDAVQLTKKGVITHVYPLEGNEAVIGYDIFNDSIRNREAFKALEKHQLYFAGPFELVQGGVAVVGRLPIFKHNDFVGFSVVLIKLKTLLAAAGIDKPKKEFNYQLSKFNSLTRKEEFFVNGPVPSDRKFAFSVQVPDGEWNLYVMPRDDFFQVPAALFISIIGLLFSATAGVFAWYLVRQPEKLNRLVEEKASEVVHLKQSAVTTIERVSDAFVSLDRNWCYTYMNKKAGEIFARDPKTMIGKHIWTEFPEGVGQPFYHAYHKAMNEQKYVYLEEYYEPYDQWFENHIYPSPDGISIYFRNVTETKKAAQLLEASEKYYRTLIEKSTDAIVLFDRSRRIIYHSPSTERITGYTYEELHNSPSFAFVHPSQMEYLEYILASIIDKPGASARATFQFPHKDGHQLWIEGTYTNWLQDPNIKAMVLNYHDVTERVEAEEKIKSANRFYHFTSHINQMMIHAKDEKKVYEEVCRIAVEVGRFRMAWIGILNEEENIIVPVSFAGHESGYISHGRIDLNDPTVKGGPTATAMRNGIYFYCNDIENDLAMKPWAEAALERGFRASIALPIRKHGKVMGIFHIYSEDTFCFDETEIALLEEASRNISFTLESIQNDTLRKRAEKQIENEKILSDSIINNLPGVFYLYDRSGKFVRWNNNFEKVTGYSGDEVKNMHPLDFFRGDERKNVEAKIGEVFNSGHAEVTAYFSHKDGSASPFYFNGTRVNFDGVEYLIGMGIDITPRVKAEEELRARTEEIQKLTGYLQDVREEERKHIAREIHDVIGQQLTAMKMDASWVKKKVSEESSLQRLNGLISLIDETIRTVRRISSELRPVMLDDFGLISALEWQASEFQKNTGIKVSFRSEVAEIELEGNLAANIFRVYQEALTNIARHSQATEVNSLVDCQNDVLKLVISDNGVGFDPEDVKKKKSLGLVGMKERARMFEGELVVYPNHPSGTIVVLKIPLKNVVNITV
jgi:PAS domain S-box-containing protein